MPTLIQQQSCCAVHARCSAKVVSSYARILISDTHTTQQCTDTILYTNREEIGSNLGQRIVVWNTRGFICYFEGNFETVEWKICSCDVLMNRNHNNNDSHFAPKNYSCHTQFTCYILSCEIAINLGILISISNTNILHIKYIAYLWHVSVRVCHMRFRYHLVVVTYTMYMWVEWPYV
jgi:hypothetical protein